MPKFLPFHRLPEKGLMPTAKVYGPGIRIWHWLNALAVLVLVITGYFIGVPPPSAIGDTSTLYVMGWIRFLHLASGYIFTLLCIMRLWLVFVEGGITYQLYLPTFWRKIWFAAFLRQIRWNLLIDRAQRYVGLNPLANVAMLTMFVIPGAIIIFTGFAMYAEVTGHDSWQYFLFGWVTMLFGNTLDLHVFHRLAMWVMVWFAMIHMYIVVREDILSRQTVVSTMLSGERQFRD